MVGSRLDLDVNAASCRLCFFARVVEGFRAAEPLDLERLRIFKRKSREGTLDRLMKDKVGEGKIGTVIGKDLFKKESDMQTFTGMQIETEHGEIGLIQGGFGKSGKFKVTFKEGTAAKPKGQCSYHRCTLFT